MTTPIPGNTLPWGRPLPGSPVGLQDQLKDLEYKKKAGTAKLAALEGALRAAKRGGKASAIKAAEAKVAAAKASLDAISKSYANLQNKYYEATGQYDKLLSGTNRDAFLAITTLFKSYGLESLAGKIYDYVKNGYSGDTISILLQDTTEYKTRFAGNEARLKAGLPVLSAGEYLATEASYRQIMESAGMPIGFYDQSSDFVKWIGKNVSPTEIQSRVDMAVQATTLAPVNYRKALEQMGISQSEMAAYFLDPARALPFLQKSAATAAIGAEALQQGLSFDQSYAEQLAMRGVTASQAHEGYGQVASELQTMQGLGSIYGQDWTQRESEESAFGTSAEATRKKAGLLSQERGAFSGGSGGARAGLGGRGGQK